MTGLFITLEGGDGAGKTTQAALLEDLISATGREVVRTREPGGTGLGLRIRELLLTPTASPATAPSSATSGITSITPRAEALLYAADRAQHVAEVVAPALARNAVVVQDRYIDSSLAYQGAGRVLSVSDVRRISEWASGGLWPDLTVLLDVDTETAAERRSARGGVPDRLEAEAAAFHEAVREGFLALAGAAPDRYLVIPAVLPAEEIHALIRERVTPLLAET